MPSTAGGLLYDITHLIYIDGGQSSLGRGLRAFRSPLFTLETNISHSRPDSHLMCDVRTKELGALVV